MGGGVSMQFTMQCAPRQAGTYIKYSLCGQCQPASQPRNGSAEECRDLGRFILGMMITKIGRQQVNDLGFCKLQVGR